MLLNPYLATTGVGAGSAYFFEEGFENATGYDNTWSETGATGTVNEDYTTSPLAGSQSLLLSTSSQHPKTTAVLPSDQTELWGFFMIRIDTTISTARRILCFLNVGGTEEAGIHLTTSSTMAGYAGAAGTATTDALTTGVNYNVWFHVRKGSGANGFASVGFSTGTTEVTAGNAFQSKSDGANTSDFHSITCQITNPAGTNTTSGAVVFDKILLSTTGTIGNNP